MTSTDIWPLTMTQLTQNPDGRLTDDDLETLTKRPIYGRDAEGRLTVQAEPRTAITLRLPDELLEHIDAERGDVPRNTWVVTAIERELGRELSIAELTKAVYREMLKQRSRPGVTST